MVRMVGFLLSGVLILATAGKNTCHAQDPLQFLDVETRQWLEETKKEGSKNHYDREEARRFEQTLRRLIFESYHGGGVLVAKIALENGAFPETANLPPGKLFKSGLFVTRVTKDSVKLSFGKMGFFTEKVEVSLDGNLCVNLGTITLKEAKSGSEGTFEIRGTVDLDGKSADDYAVDISNIVSNDFRQFQRLPWGWPPPQADSTVIDQNAQFFKLEQNGSFVISGLPPSRYVLNIRKRSNRNSFQRTDLDLSETRLKTEKVVSIEISPPSEGTSL